MKARNNGAIVNIASIAGKEGNPNSGHYSAAKAGVIALTKSLAKELARTGVIVWEDFSEIKKQGLEDAAYR